MGLFLSICLWAVFVALLELLMWYIFYRRTERICFLDEPGLPLSRLLSLRGMQILIVLHSLLLIGTIAFFHVLLW